MMNQPDTNPSEIADFASRVLALRQRIDEAATRADRDPERVTLMAITKTVAPDRVRAAWQAGLTVFGENRVQEAQNKIAAAALPGEARWEMVGHLQSNKAARAIGLFSRIQSVDSIHLAATLDERAAALDITMPVLLEVNVGGEPAKTGFAPEQLTQKLSTLVQFSHLRVEGLMTVAPVVTVPEEARPWFVRMRLLRDTLRGILPARSSVTLDVLSMGMSDDFEVAIEEGATVVRLGRALFGARPPVPR